MRTKTVRKNKKLVLLISVVTILILALTAGTTLAWLKSSSGPVVNTSNIDAYIRATVVINWVDDKGNIAAQKPEAGKDYTISYASNTGWWPGDDGFYYYSSPVAPWKTTDDKDLTGILINSCQLAEGAQVPDGYSLSVRTEGSC